MRPRNRKPKARRSRSGILTIDTSHGPLRLDRAEQALFARHPRQIEHTAQACADLVERIQANGGWTPPEWMTPWLAELIRTGELRKRITLDRLRLAESELGRWLTEVEEQ